MRSLEIVLIVLTAFMMLLTLFRPNISFKLLIVGASSLVIVLVIQLVVEGYRWQMLLVYFLAISTLLLVILTLVTQRPVISQPYARIGTAIIGILLLGQSLFLSTVLPITKLPPSSGLYAVGTMSMMLIDPSREEIYTIDPTDRREFRFQIWYPIVSGIDSVKSPYIEDIDIAGPALAKRLDLPPFLLSHLKLIRTNAYSDSPISPDGGPFPLIIFSHGLMGIRMQNTFMMEELASNGYVVASPDHTYDSVLTVVSNDRVVFHDSEALFPEDITRLEAGRILLEERQKDLSTMTDRLLEMNQESDSMFFTRLDTSSIGMIGHSTGGGTAIQICLVDERCQAVAALDSWVEPISTKSSQVRLTVPALFMNSSEWLGPENKALGKEMLMESQAPAAEVVIEGADHNNFTDIPLLSPLTPIIGLAGSINSGLAHEIMNDYVLAFFDRVLGSDLNTLQDLEVQKYPQASIEFYEP